MQPRLLLAGSEDALMLLPSICWHSGLGQHRRASLQSWGGGIEALPREVRTTPTPLAGAQLLVLALTCPCMWLWPCSQLAPSRVIGFPAPSHLRRLFQPDACHVSLTSYSLGSPLSQVDKMTSATTNILFFCPGPSPTPPPTLTQHFTSRAEISLTRRGQRIQLDQLHSSQRTEPLPGPGPETV